MKNRVEKEGDLKGDKMFSFKISQWRHSCRKTIPESETGGEKWALGAD